MYISDFCVAKWSFWSLYHQHLQTALILTSLTSPVLEDPPVVPAFPLSFTAPSLLYGYKHHFTNYCWNFVCSPYHVPIHYTCNPLEDLSHPKPICYSCSFPHLGNRSLHLSCCPGQTNLGIILDSSSLTVHIWSISKSCRLHLQNI